MGDLQCPATVVLVPRETLARAGWPTGPLAGVFLAASSATEVEAVKRTAHAASCRVELLGIDVRTLRAAIDDLSDLHRGETIAVVATADEIAKLLGETTVPPEPITVEIDSSGWSLIRAPRIDRR